MRTIRPRSARAVVLLLGFPAAAAAQLPLSSTRAVALGEGYTAAARGHEAIAWNPALLGLPDRPAASFNLVQFGARMGSNSFGRGDFNTYQGKFLTSADKDTLLQKIRQGNPSRPLTLDARVGVTGLAFQLGGLAASLSAAAETEAAVSSDAIELLLYGNVTRRAPGQVYRGTGTSARAWGGASFALAYGHRLPTLVGALAVGATLKVTRGIVVARADDLGTSLQTTPTFVANAGVHALVSDVDRSTNNGRAVGLDLGGAYDLPSGVRFGLVIENLISHVSWSDDHLVYYRKQYRLVQNGDQLLDSTIADLDRVPYNAGDPRQRALHDSISAGTYPTRIRAGMALDAGLLYLAAGATFRANKGFDVGTAQQVAAGIELRAIPFLPLRIGLATDFANGTTLAGGLGVKAGPVRLDGALSNTPSGDHKGFQLAVGASIMH